MRTDRLEPTLVRQVATFAVIGVASTAAYAVLYVMLRAESPPQMANGLALVITAVANTLLNRRLTFGIRGRHGVIGDLTAGMVAFAFALLITSSSVTVLGVVAPGSGRLIEIAVLTGANGVATASRFLVLRFWLASRGRAAAPSTELAVEQVNR
jgi:putative flippase GtrA